MSSPGDDDDDDDDVGLLDPAPPPDEQMAIVTALEEEESLHAYSVSREWHHQWKTYVGLSSSVSAFTPTEPEFRSSGGVAKDPSPPSECKMLQPPIAPPSEWRGGAPGPVTMDLNDDEGNIYIDELIWKCWVRWYGVAASHELDRRNWASDLKDFEICVLSPYCGLIENPSKTFDISEECGYIELQLRQIFRVARHRSTRLWVCEKARHSRFQPLLHRQREICSYEYIDPVKNYILALEVANLDDSWPIFVPGKPSGSFDAYREVTEGGPGPRSSLWETGLAETLETVFGAISNELKETASGIVKTAKCVTTIKEAELDDIKEALRTKLARCEESQATVEERTRDLRLEKGSLEVEKRKLREEKESFQEQRHRFAEELVRMHTINMIQGSRVKLNVGGHLYMTSTFTLTKEPDSMLAAMFSGRHPLKQEDDGSYFLDRDGTHFRYILNYLRDGSFRPGTLPANRSVLSELLSEAEYFQVGGLIELLTEVLKSGDWDEGGDPPGSGKTFSSASGYHARVTPSPGKRTMRKISVPQKAQGSNP